MIATAALATGVGFLVLLLSPVPMVRSFGLLLVAGIGIAFALALTAGTAALSLGLAPRRRATARWRARCGARASCSRARAGALARPARRAGGASRADGAAAARPRARRRAGARGGGLGRRLAHRGRVGHRAARAAATCAAVEDLQALQEATGVAGEVDVVVEGADLTQPAVVKWMRDYQTAVLRRYGYSAERGCARAELCPALSLSDLFRSEQAASDRARIRALLDAVPPYFSRAVITEDRRTATLAFGIRLVSLERQQEIIDDLRDRLDPPAGVSARLAGLPVLAAEANANLSDPLRRLATLAARPARRARGAAPGRPARRRGRGARAWQRAWVPLVPIALATGWSALVLFLLRVPLNPLSAALGALVLAISTEFAVLLSARFEAERAAGFAPAEALRRTYRSTGAAVLASGATAIAGLRRARALRRAHAARLRARHGRRPHGVAARRARRAAGRAGARRAPGGGARRRRAGRARPARVRRARG